MPMLPTGNEPTSSLAGVLRQCEDLKDLVAESGKDLSALRAFIEQDLESVDLSLARESALKTSDAIQTNIQKASENLSRVLTALEDEVRERTLLEHQFAAVTEQEERARHASLHDALTGLPNRDLFDDRLEHGLAQARRHDWTLALMFVDLDDFKTINDQHGHDVGDSALQSIARRLKDHTRREDTVGRRAGDEFLYLAVAVDREATILVAEKIIKEIQAPLTVKVRDVSISLSIKASVGISLFPKHGTDAPTLLEIADKAMYRAKRDKSGYAFAE